MMMWLRFSAGFLHCVASVRLRILKVSGRARKAAANLSSSGLANQQAKFLWPWKFLPGNGGCAWQSLRRPRRLVQAALWLQCLGGIFAVRINEAIFQGQTWREVASSVMGAKKERTEARSHSGALTERGPGMRKRSSRC